MQHNNRDARSATHSVFQHTEHGSGKIDTGSQVLFSLGIVMIHTLVAYSFNHMQIRWTRMHTRQQWFCKKMQRYYVFAEDLLLIFMTLMGNLEKHVNVIAIPNVVCARMPSDLHCIAGHCNFALMCFAKCEKPSANITNF